MHLYKRLICGALTFALAIGFVAIGPAAAAAIPIVVNGSTVTFDQPPIERAGRVFVPLRGVFERLGASVVYANGEINAQGNGRSVALHIGSNQATVNGQTAYLDQAPFLVGARTLVPLRFVAQALGATVNYNYGSHTVYINGNGNSSTSSNPAPVSNASFRLENRRPNTHSNTLQPRISADFSEPINRDSLHVFLDNREVTQDVYLNGGGTAFYFTPRNMLSSGSHTVHLTGTTAAGAGFDRQWSFSTQNGVSQNFVHLTSPGAGTKVGSSFTLRGTTLPNSKVHIIATGVANLGPIPIGTGSFQVDTTADANGRFSQQVQVNAFGGGQVRVLIQSQSPDGAAAELPVLYST
ncbi:MAG TPA: copper amine oxidase N-terminal domain-containing protein [Candidatus Baltobacteraceae bacterium]|jgi:hypothetical protein